MSGATASPDRVGPVHGERIADCLRAPELFNPWELTFLRGVEDKPRLSRRQAAMVSSLFAKLVRRSDAR